MPFEVEPVVYHVDVLKMGPCQVRGPEVGWVGTHHRSSVAYAIDTEEGHVVVTDCCFKYGNIDGNHPLGIMESLLECMAAYRRIREEADVVIPLYDPEVLQRLPEGQVA